MNRLVFDWCWMASAGIEVVQCYIDSFPVRRLLSRAKQNKH